jgi:flavodoxin I
MEKIGLFYGTDTGNTETIAKEVKKKLEAKLGADSVDLLEIYKKKKEDMDKYTLLILGMPTWYDGELQGDWEEFIPEMEKVNFSAKKVAFFGLGDQYGYAAYFCDALGVFAELVEKNHGQIVGFTSSKGYEHDESKAQRGDKFVGLCLDTDNQDELTDQRLESWLPLVIQEFGIAIPA